MNPNLYAQPSGPEAIYTFGVAEADQLPSDLTGGLDQLMALMRDGVLFPPNIQTLGATGWALGGGMITDSGGVPGGGGTPQSPTWWLQTKVFVSTLDNNIINEFKPNGCFAQFANELAGTGGGPPGAGPEDVIRSTGQAAAATYAVSQGLSYPLKSYIYRGILGGTETAAAAYTLGAFDYEVGKAFVNEMESLAAGTCQ
ncbi:MAG: hypothetical protein ACRD4X_01075 [Candidatus Acidiferrales bacterium]